MTKKFNIKRILSAILAATILCAGTIFPVHAEENDPKIRIGIAPLYNKVELDPGEKYTEKVTVTNAGKHAFDFKMTAEPYQETEDGSGKYGNESKYSQITDWITFDIDKGTLDAGESKEITYTVNVPEKAPGGGQYVAIIAEAINDAKNVDGVEIGEKTRIAYILLAQINGDIDECVKIINNSINTFMFEPPIMANSLVENCGNTHETIYYTMKVSTLFSDNFIYTNEEDPTVRTVLPEARRFNTLSWSKEDGAPMFGIFNVEQTVKVGKETSTVKKLVFIFPLWLVIIIILFILAVIFWLVSRSRQRKEAKRSSVNTPVKSDKSED